MHVYVELRGFPNSYAFLSEEEDVHEAAIFVHGFNGDSFSTWCQFQDMLLDHAGWSPLDVYFFDYASTDKRIAACALDLAKFVKAICGSAVTPIRPTVPLSEEGLYDDLQQALLDVRRIERRYTNLRLIGHSQGGLVIRHFILDCASDFLEPTQLPEDEKPLPLSAAVHLFAPAIGQASPTGLNGLLLSLGGFGSLIRALLGMSASYADMQPGSSVLTQTNESTTKYAEQFKNLSGFRARILWADTDEVVSPTRYHYDFSCKPNPAGTNHQTVCKPTLSYPHPLEFALHGTCPPKPSSSS